MCLSVPVAYSRTLEDILDDPTRLRNPEESTVQKDHNDNQPEDFEMEMGIDEWGPYTLLCINKKVIRVDQFNITRHRDAHGRPATCSEADRPDRELSFFD